MRHGGGGNRKERRNILSTVNCLACGTNRRNRAHSLRENMGNLAKNCNSATHGTKEQIQPFPPCAVLEIRDILVAIRIRIRTSD
jgi:hypothetical protein